MRTIIGIQILVIALALAGCSRKPAEPATAPAPSSSIAPDLTVEPIADLTVVGERCGGVVCSPGLHCCNPTCNLCTPKGVFCTQQTCN